MISAARIPNLIESSNNLNGYKLKQLRGRVELPTPSPHKGVSWQQFNCRFNRHKALANMKKFYLFIVRMKILFREQKGKHFRTAKHLKSDSSTPHECIQQNKCKFMAN